ncbi:MAG: hypothetical protein QOD30_2513 [Actinomycetota bacterium]|jgi:hypothetical protein|nr:hypothetical protein [Actinomycetota bacterium]
MRARPIRLLPAIAAISGLGIALAPAAGACGGLVGENGTIQLERTTTLAAYHDGVERYVTSFQFTGEGKEVGSIVPLPDVPSKVERGGDWTLQRLEREVAPPAGEAFDGATNAAGAASAQVILTAKIDALDITILRGGGDEVGRWASENGFLLTPDAPEVLDYYASRSPIFMAAKFDASRAATLGQRGGDGTPIMLTIPTDAPWVPLRILGLGLDGGRQVQADVFLLTDERPALLAGGRGLSIGRSERASASLLDDLRTDVGMTWVPSSMWFTHLPLSTSAKSLDYDLAVSVRSGTVPSLVDAGVSAPAARPVLPKDSGIDWWPLVVGTGAGVMTLVLVGLRPRRELVA